MSCADFVGHLFLARDVAHSTHLNTRSFFQALGFEHVLRRSNRTSGQIC